MLRWFSVILFFLISSTVSFGQFSDEEQRQIDILNTIINNPESHDTSLASSYVELSGILYISNLDTVMPLCAKAQEIAEKALESRPSSPIANSLLKALAGAINNIGYIYEQQGDIPLALEYYHKSLALLEEVGNKK
ncbi:MAG: hypothetical protein JKY42_03150, partial [Flavobacteriales bacterium]|nr:hypothetical protein [Flavobacteriales bacterium]